MAKGSSTYRTLEEFIQNRMAMSRIYQPAMLIEMLRNDGRSAVTEIAKALLEHDQSQIEYYEQITKNMVGRVLTDSNAITRKLKDGNRVTGFEIPDFDQLTQARGAGFGRYV